MLRRRDWARSGRSFSLRAHLCEALPDCRALLRRQDGHDASAERFHLGSGRARSGSERTAERLTNAAYLLVLGRGKVCGAHRTGDRRPMVGMVIARCALRGTRDADAGEGHAGDDGGAEGAFQGEGFHIPILTADPGEDPRRG